MSKVSNPTKVITGKHTVFSYLTVNEPKVPLGGGTPKYSVSLIIPKSDTVTVEKIKAAIQAAYDEGQGKLKGNSKTVPALEDLKTPLRDGDKERQDRSGAGGSEDPAARWRQGAQGRRSLRQRLVHQCQQHHQARRCGC